MRYLIFATGGHVDHGKTSLIKALTGIDTDRLPEEKRRGMSIDIGFAYIDFPEINTRLEIIDVPGHERFVKNAIAGLSSAVGIMLVVDPLEGVMPQTVEHLSVAKGFGIERGVAVLTKIDKVDRETLELAKEELRDFLKAQGVEMPIVCVSSITGEGLSELKKTLKDIMEGYRDERSSKPLRVLVDSAFTVKGYGTVLRGSCIEGEVREGETVVVEPLGVETKVRRIQNHGVFVKEAKAGERVAFNLPELEASKVERGFWILKPNSYVKGDLLIIKSQEALSPGRLYSVFFGMREVFGKFKRIEEGIYLLKTQEEVVSRRGDKVIILSSSGRLVGGGEVLHPKVIRVSKRFLRENIKEPLESFEVYLLKELGAEGLEGSYFRRLTGLPPDTKVLQKEGVKVGDRFYSKEVLERLRKKMLALLREELGEGRFGVSKAEVMDKLGLNQDLFEHLLGSLGRYKLIDEFIVEEGKGKVEEHPKVKKLLELLSGGFMEEREIISSGISKEVLNLAVKRRLVHNVGAYLYLSDENLNKFVAELRELGDEFSVQEAKAKLGLTRKYLIPLLEYLDFLGLTVRDGERRRWKSVKGHRP